MESRNKKRLQNAGWVVSDASEFLQLSPEQSRFVELKFSLSAALREARERCGLTQTALAARLGSSQSRVAKMESADASVSLDLLVRALLAAGATTTEIAKWIRRAEPPRAA